jgi:hypothetical protein
MVNQFAFGGGNALGMFLLLANQFPDCRIVGSRYKKFVDLLSERRCVDPFCSTASSSPSAPDEPTQWTDSDLRTQSVAGTE